MIINLTPHVINIQDIGGNPIINVPPSGLVARIATSREVIGIHDGVPLFRTVPIGEPVNLPPENAIWHQHNCRRAPGRRVLPTDEQCQDCRPGTAIYIVSGMFRLHFDRSDLYQPGELVRGADGQPVGCIGLSR
jgi:hypothetical protein